MDTRWAVQVRGVFWWFARAILVARDVFNRPACHQPWIRQSWFGAGRVDDPSAWGRAGLRYRTGQAGSSPPDGRNLS